jgi:hypothetical protein
MCVDSEVHGRTVGIVSDCQGVAGRPLARSTLTRAAVLAKEHHRQRPRLINVARPIRIISQDFHLARHELYPPNTVTEFRPSNMGQSRPSATRTAADMQSAVARTCREPNPWGDSAQSTCVDATRQGHCACEVRRHPQGSSWSWSPYSGGRNSPMRRFFVSGIAGPVCRSRRNGIYDRHF